MLMDPTNRSGATSPQSWIIAGGTLLALSGITLAVTRIQPAASTIDRNMIWIDTVRRGEMVRKVRGVGTLVPEQISWITARSAGRVDHIVLRPGAPVTPDDVILVLSSPQVTQAAADAASRLKAAEAEFNSSRDGFISGLQPGDRVILSDTSQWDNHDRIRLN